MATEAAKEAWVDSEFFLMDAENMNFDEQFDVIWSIESISHYADKKKFFESALNFLKPGGTIALIDWFKKEDLSEKEFEKYIVPIEEGMLVELQTMTNYVSYLQDNGCEVLKIDNLNDRTSKTWDISLDIIKNKSFWDLALKNGKEFVHFLQSFRSMKAGFSSWKFVYGMIIAKKSK